MIVRSSIVTDVDACRPTDSLLIAALDVEWSKNYRVRNGNIPFCYSVVWMVMPPNGLPPDSESLSYRYESVYVEHADETQDLIASADAAVSRLLADTDVIVGHQLCSDLAILSQSPGGRPPAVDELRAAWLRRRTSAAQRPRIIDTRYDIGHVLSGTSRRLVDVCGQLRLSVTQPELRGTSMTALHRHWLDNGDSQAREKISVLNLRHSLSTALAATRAAETAGFGPSVNVNRMLASGLGQEFRWPRDPAFRALLADIPCGTTAPETAIEGPMPQARMQ